MIDEIQSIGFNKPYLSGKELEYIQDAVASKKISGNGKYTNLCQNFFQQRFGDCRCLLTTSCTDALEMAAILCNIQPGDEVIMPSYTFVSTANAFILRGAKIVFCDSRKDHPGMDEDTLESLVTSRTKAIVPVHYAGVACDMHKIMSIARQHNLFVIEDAAQAIDGYFIDGIQRRHLGNIGHFGCFSFHETKNIQCGEGGMLVVNSKDYRERAEIIWEKGTNRSAFFRGEIDKYGWVDIGSSFLPSDIIAAFLHAQLECLELIQEKRKYIWNSYDEGLVPLRDRGLIKTPYIPEYATNNAHMYYVLCKDGDERQALISHLNKHSINAVFHYLSLHKSSFYKDKCNGLQLPQTDYYSDTLLRLPLYYEMTDADVERVLSTINEFYLR